MCVQKRHNHMNNFLCYNGTQVLLLFKNKATKHKHIQTNQIHRYAISVVLYYSRREREKVREQMRKFVVVSPIYKDWFISTISHIQYEKVLK